MEDGHQIAGDKEKSWRRGLWEWEWEWAARVRRERNWAVVGEGGCFKSFFENWGDRWV